MTETGAFDVIIVGAGPAGLSFATSLALEGLHVALIERQSLSALSRPAFDGREIALTVASQNILRSLGAWQHFHESDISPLVSAQIRNGAAHAALTLSNEWQSGSPMVNLVSNHKIREALFRAAIRQPGIEMMAGRSAVAIQTDAAMIHVKLSDGASLRGRLLVAADSRLSPMRAQLGIDAEIQETGRAILTFRIAHEADHHRMALEWFDHHRTVALLPLNGGMSSVVLTLRAEEAQRLFAMTEKQFDERLAQDRGLQLGRIRLASSRHIYPLLVTYARNFIKPRAALIGDAAVGMHPVTAHGFNFGLRGQETLAAGILAAVRQNRDLGSHSVLRQFEILHRRATRPLFLATNALVRLYTDESVIGRMVRRAVLQAGRHLPLAPAAVSAALMAS